MIVNEIQAGFGKLKALHGSRFVPVMVPPWNRISPEIAGELPKLGYKSLSVFGREKQASLSLLNTHVDIMNWHGVRGGRPADALYEELLAYSDDPVPALGILTHHLVHDETAWSFLESFLHLTCGTSGLPMARSLRIDQLTLPGFPADQQPAVRFPGAGLCASTSSSGARRARLAATKAASGTENVVRRNSNVMISGPVDHQAGPSGNLRSLPG